MVEIFQIQQSVNTWPFSKHSYFLIKKKKKREKIIALTTYFEKIMKNKSSISKGGKNKNLLGGLQNTSFIYLYTFFGFVRTATAIVLTGCLRLLCA